MTDQELKKLKRDELLQIMIAQSKRITQLKKKLEEAEKQLAEKEIRLREVGSIAEASLKLNHIFEDAQNAADQYLYNIMLMARRYQKALEKVEGRTQANPQAGRQEAELSQGGSREDSAAGSGPAADQSADGAGADESAARTDSEPLHTADGQVDLGV